MALAKLSQVFLCVFALALAFQSAHSQWQWPRLSQTQSQRRSRGLFPGLRNPNCDFCPTTSTTTESHDPNDPEPGWPPSFISPKVDFLGIAETCSANFITQDYENDWEEKKWPNEVNRFRIRLTNKLFVYLMSFNMFETNGLDITESQMTESSCFLTTMINGWGITNTTGFGGRAVTLRMARTTLPKVFRFSLPYGPVGAMTGTASIILSDNLSYTVFEFCFDKGLRTFAMFTKGYITENELASVKLHLKAIGYKEKHIIDLKPDDNCLGDFGAEILHGQLNPKSGASNLPSPRSPDWDYLNFINTNLILPVPPLFWKKK